MATIYIDNVPYEVNTGKNLLEVCLSLGLNLPYFCWHPAMGSVGACRQCAVKVFKDEQDTRGRLVMSCMEPVKDNLHMSIEDGTAKAFRAQIIEWLMTNHPHDCAVCDEGGSCHLQDMTVMTGHAYRRFNYKKRTYNNQYLGPFINHEMNRCIQCYRCVRFYKDYAGGKDLDVFAAHNHVYFGRVEDGILENEFSGNLAEVCPTGVFTDKTLKEHYTRKWDLTMAPSICQHCSLGCNIIGGERYGELRQITNRYNGEVNGHFICDRGRFGYEFVNSINRLKQPLIRGMIPEAVDKHSLYSYLGNFLSGKMVGIGSPRASLESNFALRQLVGKDNFYQGVSEETSELMDTVLSAYNSIDIHIPSLKETETADVVLVLGEDLTNSAPMLALSVRQAVRNTPLENADKINIPEWQDAARREITQQEKGDCVIAYPIITRLDEVCSQVHHMAPDDITRLGFAIANLIDPLLPAVKDQDENLLQIAGNIADILKKAKNPLIISGTSLFNPSIINAAAGIAAALKQEDKKAMLFLVVPECNSLGLAMMKAPAFKNATNVPGGENAETLIILENDLYRTTPEKEVDALMNAFKQVIVFDHLNNRTTAKANILVPVGTFAEADGTLVNNEGRAQCFFQVFVPANENVRESWRWLNELDQLKNGNTVFDSISPNKLIRDLVGEMSQFTGAEAVIPRADLRIKDQKVPREPHRYSGRTAMHANEDVSEQKPPADPDTPLSFTMEGYSGIPPAPLTPFFWAPGWNSGQSLHKYQTEVGGPLYGGDPGVRLLSNNIDRPVNEFANIPVPFRASEDEWLLIPLPHIFGSEELSMYTSGVAERAPKPYIAIGKLDADTLNVREEEILKVKIASTEYVLPVRIKDELGQGIAGLPYNLNEMAGIKWPAKGTLTNGVKWKAPYTIS
jgi:NADH-quinone oxidoreductase subunit G